MILENSGQYSPPAPFAESPAFWKLLFFSVFAGYGLYYAPCGINETDGGFLTGLAWQVTSGKALYGEVIYVRPPLPVWLRALEMQLVPGAWAVLGERWIFYLKVALYSWLAASLLGAGARRWLLAVLGFVVSVHCYPPMAWHTVDGILFSVLGIWCFYKIPDQRGAALAGVAIAAALLCKQSFYPMAAVFAACLLAPDFPRFGLVRKVWATGRPGWGMGALVFCLGLLGGDLYTRGLLANFLQMTGSPASGGQAVQHGLLDYFRIKPVLAVATALLLAPCGWLWWKRERHVLAVALWLLWLLLLTGSYAFDIWRNHSFTVPFAQTRLLFWVACLYALHSAQSAIRNPPSPVFPLLAISWCASVSWGYNLPVLFATPWVFAALEISGRLWQRARPGLRLYPLNIAVLVLLLLVFRLGYEYVYRDGPRSAMHTPLGPIFPALQGIYASPEKADLYQDLKNLAARYPNFKTLPTLPQASFLTGTYPPLPLDWVVNRETNGDNDGVIRSLEQNRPFLFIEKSWLERIPGDSELSLTRDLMRQATILDESAHFLVIKPK